MASEFIGILQIEGLLNRRQLLHGEWLTPEEPTTAEHLAKQYHTECDAYDRGICTGNRNGEPIPVTPIEQRLVNQHSLNVRQRLLRENGITEKQLHEAIISSKER